MTSTSMSYEHLAYVHLITVLPAFVLGTVLMLWRKGTAGHKTLGKIYLSLMAVTAIVTLFMPAKVGPTIAGHWGMLHLLSVLALITMTRAVVTVRRGEIKRHRGNMLGLYLGGLVLAGSFALMPGRMLHSWLFGA